MKADKCVNVHHTFYAHTQTEISLLKAQTEVLFARYTLIYVDFRKPLGIKKKKKLQTKQQQQHIQLSCGVCMLFLPLAKAAGTCDARSTRMPKLK